MGKNKNTFISIFLFTITGICAGSAAQYYGKSRAETLYIIVMALTGIGIALFLYAEGREKNTLAYDNKKYFGRFAYCYLFCLIAALLFPFLPVLEWSFLVIFVIMGLTSNRVAGIAAGSTLLLMTVMLTEGSNYQEFFLYFVSGITGIILFSYVDEHFRVGLPMLISLLVFFVCIAAYVILLREETLSSETGFMILANFMVCTMLLLVFLRYYSFAVVYRYRDKYMEINDPECPLLVELKHNSQSEYYQAIHTAYLSDKIAKRLKLNDLAARTCGYYHKIGTLRGDNSWASVLEICEEYHFPPGAAALLKEYIDRETFLTSKEAIAVLFADTMVTSVLYVFSRDPKVVPDYAQIVEAIYQKKMESGVLDHSMITFGELKEMKKLLVEEKLYYDFLR